MAKIYESQKYYAKAKEAYLYLLAKDPNNQILITKIYDIDSFFLNDNKFKQKNLVPLFDRWLELCLKTYKFKKLKKLRERLNEKANNS